MEDKEASSPNPTRFPYRTFTDNDDERPSQPFNLNECLETLRGKGLPSDLSSRAARCSVVRAIRLYPEFAEADSTLHLYEPNNKHFKMVFVRARNARRIMSGIVPDDMDDADTQPYCIWHPEFASEDIYRQLVKRYPGMKYQVGRACAAAGYANLYAELDVLPDVSTAEEARESTNSGSKQIYDAIMCAPFKYKVMNDNKRAIDTENPRHPAYLDAQTQVLSELQDRVQPFEGYEPVTEGAPMNEFWFRIEEDAGLHFENIQYGQADEETQHEDKVGNLDIDYKQQSIRDAIEARWLYEPLPLDLPTLRTDLLSLMAAYDGNIDRYSRLEIDGVAIPQDQFLCILRGIYHHTMFARWWHQRLLAPDFKLSVLFYSDEQVISWLRTAINARRIMISDVDGFNKDSEDLPFVIWWPARPTNHALVRLLENCPQMKHQITVAAIICDYPDVYRAIDPAPSVELEYAAEASTNRWYLDDIRERAKKVENYDSDGICTMISGTYGLYKAHFEEDQDWLVSHLTSYNKVGQGSAHEPLHPYDKELHMQPVERYVWLNKTVIWKLRELFDGIHIGRSKSVEEWDPEEEDESQDADEETKT